MDAAKIGRDEARGAGGEVLVADYQQMPRRMRGAITEWLKGERKGNPRKLPLQQPSSRDAGLVAYRDPQSKVVRFRDYTGRYVSTSTAKRRLNPRQARIDDNWRREH